MADEKLSRDRRFPVSQVAGRGGWQVNARPYGRIRSILFPGWETPMRLMTREMAEEVRKHLLIDVYDKGIDPKIAVANYMPRQATVRSAFDKWFEHLDGLVAAGKKEESYVKRLKEYARPEAPAKNGKRAVMAGPLAHIADMSIYRIHFGTLEDLALWMKNEYEGSRGPIGDTTIFHAMNTLRTCLNWTAKRSNKSFVAPEFPVLQRGEHEPKLLTMAEQDLVLEQIPEPQRGAFLAMAELMIRPGEARAINVGDYDWSTKKILLRNAMKGLTKKAKRGKTKTKDERLLCVSGRLVEWLEAYAKPHRFKPNAPLLHNPTSKGDDDRFSYYTLADIWREASKRAGVQSVGLYNGTKHTTATWLRREQGLHLDEIALALGHAAGHKDQKSGGDKAVTALYARAPEVANARIVQLLDARRAATPGEPAGREISVGTVQPSQTGPARSEAAGAGLGARSGAQGQNRPRNPANS